MALVRRTVFGAACLTVGLAGCAGTGSPQAREENQKMDTLTRCGENLDREAGKPVLLARSQGPGVEELPPVRLGNPTNISTAPVTTPPPVLPTSDPNQAEGIRLPGDIAPAPAPAPPVTSPIPQGTRVPSEGVRLDPLPGTPDPTIKPAAGTTPALPPAPAAAPTPIKHEGDAQVKIVASIGNLPVYDGEVREAVYQRLGDLMRVPEAQRAVREKEIYKEELHKIIDRELVIDELTVTLKEHKQLAALDKLKDAAQKEADQRLKEFKKDKNIPDDKTFMEALRSQGLTLSGIRRQIERGFMMQAYLREKMTPYMDKIGLADIRDYYATHPDEFKAEDRVKWQDLFVLFERFKTQDEARQYAAGLASRAAKGADFAKLAGEFGMGDSKLRSGAGIGEKPGEIFPPDLEPTILALKQGQITVKETEAGLHVLRIAERTYAGLRPYDDKVQLEVRRRLQAQIYDREVKRMLDTMWKRTQPQIWVE
jgi:peptidyl-prolyl cis-trans isomerase SurA